MSFSGGSDVKESAWVQSLGWEDPLEKGMTTYSSILAWRIPWIEKPGGQQFMGLKESDTTEQLTHTHMFLLLENTELLPKWCRRRREDARPS